MLDRDSHQRLDQLFQHHLTGHGLRYLDHGSQIQLVDGRLDRARGTGEGLLVLYRRVRLLELSHLPSGSPTQVAVPGLPQVGVPDLLETAYKVKAGRNFVGDALNVYEAILSCRADRLLVEAHGVQVAALYSCNLRTCQCRAIFEILRTILRPYFELLVVSRQSLEMLLSLVGRCGVPGCRVGKSAIEAKHRRFEL